LRNSNVLANMELAGFLRSLIELGDHGLIVDEVVTDAHSAIKAMMGKFSLSLGSVSR
jgi:hypothetical protein